MIDSTRRALLAGAPVGLLTASALARAQETAPLSGMRATRSAEMVLADRPISVKDFGAIGDGLADDYAAIIAARDSARAAGTGLFFPKGTYAFGKRLELGFANLQVMFGDKVILKPTHAGVGISFDAGTTDLLYGIEFGWDRPPTIQGNAATTDAISIRGCHHMRLNVRIRDCAIGMRVAFSVLSEFKLNHSGNQGGWTKRYPISGLVVDRRVQAEATTACRFDLCIEGMSGMGVVLTCAHHCEFWGTSEGNSGGGVSVASESINNNFHNFFCEQNGNAPHWTVAGHNNVFLNCVGGGPTGNGANDNRVSGTRNLFVRGKFHNLEDASYYNEWRQVALSGTVRMGSNCIRERCHNGGGAELVDLFPPPEKTTPRLLGGWAPQVAAGQRPVSFSKDRSGFVHLAGAVKGGNGAIFTLPVGYRPSGTVFLTYHSPSPADVGQLSIDPKGAVRHLSGPVESVPLDNIAFLAEA